jgi:hypothetical protein
MRSACAELCKGIGDFLEPLSRALKGDSVEAIKSHRGALLSEVERIEGAAAREAQTRGQDLNEVEELMRRMLTGTQDTLRAADITLCKWEAAHHAACIEDLAGKAFEVQDGTRDWSAQGCTDFRKELDWGLQAFRKANTKLGLYLMEMAERREARLRAERVEVAARRAREVVERVLWDRGSRWESIHPEESCGQGGRQGVQARSVAGETEDAPEELLQSEPADPAEHWLGETEDAPGELPLTAQEPGEEAGRPGAEAGHLETWASRLADLPRHWLGETEDAPEELLQSEPADPAEHWLGETEDAPRELLLTAQEPGEEAGQPGVEAGRSEVRAGEAADLERRRLGGTEDASEELPHNVQGPREEVGRPRLQEESSEVPREQVPQGDGDGSRTRHHEDLHRSEDRLEEAVEAEQPRPWKASGGVPGERVPQEGERGGWPGSCRRAQHQANLPRRVGTAVSRKRRLPSGSERWREAKRRPAQRLSCEARMHGFVCLQEVAAEAAQGEQSGCRENVTPTAAEEGESGDESDLLTEDRDRAGLRGSANRGSRGPRGWDPGGLLMGA